MHDVEIAAWTARLEHVLITERYGYSHVRFPGEVPAAARTRTARHLALRGPEAIDAVSEVWPDVVALPIWSDFRRALLREPVGPLPAPMSRRAFARSSALLGDDARARTGQLLHRLVYLHDEEELRAGNFGLLTLSEAWRASTHDLVNPLGNLLELYLDNRSATARLLIRFYLRNHRILLATDEWRTLDDRVVFERFATAMERQPESLAAAPPEQIERLQRVGALAASFGSRPRFASGESDEGRPLPLARVPSAHFDLHPLREPALVTMSRVLERS